MQKSILIELLSKFNSKEIKDFGDFVHSPFFNKNESVTKLYDHLRILYPAFNENKIGKTEVFKKIFPGVKYNDGFMRTLMFILCSLAEDYLSFKRYKSNYFTDKQFLLFELNDRELNKLIEKNMEVISRKFDDEEIKGADYFYYKHTIEYEYFHYLGRTKMDKIEKILKKSDVENTFSYLTYSYLIQAMNHYVYLLNVMELYNIRFNTETLENIIKSFDVAYFKDIPSVYVCYNVLMLFLKESDHSYFYTTKELLAKYENNLNRDQVHNAYMNLKNYCKRLIQKGKTEFINELFEIQKLEIDRKLYPLQREMSFRYYTDVVETALKLKKYSWAKEFIEKYKSELPFDSQENTYTYALALYEFNMRNFQKSLEILSRVKYNDVYHKMKYRGLILMLTYELDYGEIFLSNMDSFNHFLINDTLITNERKKFYSNFIKYIKKLSVLKIKQNAHGIHRLRQKLIEEKVVFNKEWLLEKVNEIMD